MFCAYGMAHYDVIVSSFPGFVKVQPTFDGIFNKECHFAKNEFVQEDLNAAKKTEKVPAVFLRYLLNLSNFS